MPKVPKTQIYNILTNPVYAGEVHYQGIGYKGSHEKLVDGRAWANVQRYLSKGTRHKGRKYDFLFQHALSCGECGSPMCGEEKRGGRYIYYRCWKAANRQCDTGYINERSITAQLDAIFERLVFPLDYKVEMKKSYYELKHAKQNTENDENERITKERNRINNRIAKVYEDRIDEKISEALWKSTAAKLESQLQALDEAQARITKAQIPYYELFDQFLELPGMLSETWKEGNQQEKGDLVKSITSNISLKAEKVTVELVEPFDYFYKEMVLNGKYPQWGELIKTISLHGPLISRLFVKLAA
jgi:hypothetical protein